MGDDDADPGVVDLRGRDEREEGPDTGVGLAADVLTGAWPKGVVERTLVGVDIKIDRLGFDDTQERRCLPYSILTDPQGSLAERLAAFVPVNADQVAARGLPRVAVINVGDRHLRPDHDVSMVAFRGEAPACHQGGVGCQMSIGRRIQAVGQGHDTSPVRRCHADDRGSDRIGHREQKLHAVDRLVDREGLAEQDARLERRCCGRRPEGRQSRGRHHRDQTKHERRRHRQRDGAASHGDHASPAIRTIPRPFWSAPVRPVLTRAEPGP